MTDIVERLRKASLSELGLDIDKELLDYAATEIERLRVRAEIERLRAEIAREAGANDDTT